MNDPMGETGFSGESTEIVFSETEMAAAEQLMQLSEEETLSCSSSTGGGGGGERGGCKRKHEDISSRIGNELSDDVKENCDLAVEMKTKMKKMKEKKFRSLESIYRATKEIRD